MIYQLVIGGVMLASVGFPGVGAADDVADQLRCEARGLLRESREKTCLAGCVQRGTAMAARRGQAAADNAATQCQKGCEDRYNAAMQQLATRAVCGGHQPPDPNRCAGELLMAQAAELLCTSRCDRRFDPGQARDACEQGCEQDYQTAKDQVLALDICAQGFAPGVAIQ
jgi:hypothetical protein